jgi:hypothetical protein
MKSSFCYKNRWPFLLFLALVMVSGCEKIELGEPYSCRVGTKYWLDGNLSFSIDSLRDYRCPRDVICIWGGDVDIYLHIQQNLTEIDTLAGLYRKNPFQTGDYTWKILEVNPWLKSDQESNQSDYRVKLIVTRN